MFVCVFVRERECVCDFSFLFFYGHFGPKHLLTTGDNFNASYIRRIIIHPSTIIFLLIKRTYQGEDAEEAMKKATRLSLEVIQSLK